MYEFAPVHERIARMREKRNIFTAGTGMTINSERTKIYTDYYKAHRNELPILKRAGALQTWCETKEANIFEDDVFVGTLGKSERSISAYVDMMCTWIPPIVNDTDENFRKAWQSPGSVYMSDDEREIFREAYDFWKDHNLQQMVIGALTEDFYAANGNGCILVGLSSPFGPTVSGMPQGHYVAGFDKAVNVGFGAVRDEILAKLDAQRGKVFGKSAKQHVFWHAMLRVAEGAITLAKRYAAACRTAANAATGERKAELLSMADSLEWIMEKPARTYWEGLQVLILYQLMLSTDAQQHGQSMGRIDKYCGHLLEKQLADGSLTQEQAQFYTDGFIMAMSNIIMIPGFIINNNRLIEMLERKESLYTAIYNGFTATGGIALTIGGTNMDGSDDSNAMTYCVLQTYCRMKLPDPTVAFRVNKNTPEHLWRLAIESSKLCGGMPQFQNDDVVIPSLIGAGLAPEDAYNYSIVGCVEPSGTGNEWSACGMTGTESVWNMLSVVQLIINGGVNPGTGVTALPCKKLYEYESFEELKEAFLVQMKYILDWNVSYCNLFELAYSTWFPCVSASVMMEGCIESGLDVTEGGAKYNRTGETGCGTANVADSLMTIKKLCFDDKTVSLRELYDALQNNWEGAEDLRQLITNEVPHYGNDIAEVDELATWALENFADQLSVLEGPRGKHSAGTFTVTAHIFMGKMTGATPDGRRAGEPIADAISSRQGLDINGPTAYLRSAAKLPHTKLANGDQLNIRFTPTAVAGDRGAEKLRQLIEAYFDLGGMQVQFNVVSTEALREAQKDPESNKGLIVRIAGFSTYFVTLSLDTQNDFISRTEQAI